MTKKRLLREWKDNRIEMDGAGEPCPHCNRLQQKRIHKTITQEMLNQDYYLSEWCYCTFCKKGPHNQKFVYNKKEPGQVMWDDSWDDVDRMTDDAEVWIAQNDPTLPQKLVSLKKSFSDLPQHVQNSIRNKYRKMRRKA